MKHEFKTPYTFEDIEYKEIEIPIENLSGKDIMKIQKDWKLKGNFDAMINSNYEYCLELAAVAAGQPIEFFLDMPGHETSKVAQAVSLFLMG